MNAPPHAPSLPLEPLISSARPERSFFSSGVLARPCFTAGRTCMIVGPSLPFSLLWIPPGGQKSQVTLIFMEVRLGRDDGQRGLLISPCAKSKGAPCNPLSSSERRPVYLFISLGTG